MKLDANDLMEDNKIDTKMPKKRDKNSFMLKMIILAIVIITMIIIAIIIVLQKIKPIDQSLKVYVNDEKINLNSSNVFLFDGDKIYVNVKGIAGLVGYEAHNGEYKVDAEDKNKVFVENTQETASMFLNSSTISKVYTNSNEEYKNYTMSEPAREINGEIFVISDGIKIACNLSINYNSEKNEIMIGTLDYNYNKYNEGVTKIGYQALSSDFENKKAILYNRLVVQKNDGRYGVINLKGEEIIRTTYSKIQFDEYTQEFTITNSAGKMGIDFIDGETKINVRYDEIKSIQKQNELYLVKNNNKYGVIDSKERIVIHLEYDEIGVDISPYTTNINSNASKITNNDSTEKNNKVQKNKIMQYILFNKVIPVKQNEKYGFFDIKGNQISELKYSGLGCYAKEIDKTNTNYNDDKETITKTTSNILLIKDYELIIVENNEKYGIINTNAEEKVEIRATDIYSITSGGVESYYMVYNDKVYNLVTEVFEPLGIKKISENETDEEDEIMNNKENNGQAQNSEDAVSDENKQNNNSENQNNENENIVNNESNSSENTSNKVSEENSINTVNNESSNANM